MKNVLSLITYLFFVQSTFGQSRLEMQFSTHFTNARITGNWHQSLGQGLLFSVGVSSGSSARNWIDHSSEEIQDGLRVQSPYTAMNAPVDRNGNQYNLIDYGTKTRFVDLHGGLGYYHEFGAMHGIRANAYFILNYMSNDVSAYYYSMASDSEFGETKVFNHFNAGAGLEVYHTIRLTGRTTFCYGFKVPYYFTLDKARFNSQNPKDSFYGFEPEISVGITYLIGNCPEKGPQ